MAGVIFAMVLCLALAEPAALPTPFRAKVLRVTDGDTLVVAYGDGSLTVRLDAIDAPEQGQPWGSPARHRLLAMTESRIVEVRPRDWDHQRLVARVWVAGQDASLVLVAEGLAWHYRRFSSDAGLSAAEKAAREGEKGLWQDVQPIPPWEWRRNPEARGPLRLAVPPAAKIGPLHGNTSSRKYHRPGCPNYSCKSCTRAFDSPEDAQQAGFKAAQCCHGRPSGANH